MDALAFLGRDRDKPGPLYVLHGDEAFLKRQALRAIRRRALGEDADEQAVASYPGEKATFAEVFDELDTVPFFHPRRLVDPDRERHRGLCDRVPKGNDLASASHHEPVEKQVKSMTPGPHSRRGGRTKDRSRQLVRRD